MSKGINSTQQVIYLKGTQESNFFRIAGYIILQKSMLFIAPYYEE